MREKRNALFHAKTSRQPILPRGSAARREILAAHDTLARLYLALAQHCLGARRPSSAMTYAGFDLMTQRLDDSLTLHVTSASPDKQTIECALAEPANGDLLPLATRRRRNLERSGMKAFVGRCSGAAVGKLPAVTALVASYNGTPLAHGAVEGVLKPHGLVQFEGHVGLLLENREQPRENYPT
jgi:hypothetical protein